MHVGLHTTDKRTLLVSQHFEYTLLLMIADYRNENKVPNKSKYEIAAKHFEFFFFAVQQVPAACSPTNVQSCVLHWRKT